VKWQLSTVKIKPDKEYVSLCVILSYTVCKLGYSIVMVSAIGYYAH